MPILESGFKEEHFMKHADFDIHHSIDSFSKSESPVEYTPVALHHHSFYELIFFISGSVDYHVENEIYTINPGDILWISPTEFHRPVFKSSDVKYERIVLWVESEYLKNLPLLDSVKELLLERDLNPSNLIRINEKARESLLSYMDDLLEIIQNKNADAAITGPALLTLILSLIGRESITFVKATPDLEIMPTHVKRALDYIYHNLSGDLSLYSIANKCFVSPQHLSKLFKKVMGMTVHQYIKKRRLLTARHLITNGESLQNAAQKSGFNDYSVFYKAYRAEFNASPSKKS